MKNVKANTTRLIIFAFLIANCVMGQIFAQGRDSVVPVITQRELLKYSPVDVQTKDIVLLSPLKQMIMSELADGKITYYLASIENPINKDLLMKSSEKQKITFAFNADGNYFQYLYKKKGVQMLGVYNVPFRTHIIIDEPEKDVLAGSISPVSRFVVYEATGTDEFPKVYLAEADGKHPRYIADGLSGTWSPNGKWFTVMKSKTYTDWDAQSSKSKKKIMNEFLAKRKPDDFNMSWTAWLYNPLGDPILELRDFDSPRFVLWSPTSDKMIIRSYGEYDFHILDMREGNAGIQAVEIGKFGAEENKDEETHDPLFSPDGKMILYVKSFWNFDNTKCLKNQLWLSNATGTKSYKLWDTDDRTTEYPIWSSQGTLLIMREKLNYSDEVELSVVEVTIQNIKDLY